MEWAFFSSNSCVGSPWCMVWYSGSSTAASEGVLVERLSRAVPWRQALQARRHRWSSEGAGCPRVGLHEFQSSTSVWPGCLWMKTLIPAKLPGQIPKAKENHVFPTKRSTRRPCRSPANWRVHITGNGYYFFPISTSSQFRSLRESKWLQLPPYCALGDLPWGLVWGGDEPGHANSRWDCFGTDVMTLIPPFELGLGSLRRALTSTLWDWTPSGSPGLCGMPTLALGSPLLALLVHGCLPGESQPTACTPVLRSLWH